MEELRAIRLSVVVDTNKRTERREFELDNLDDALDDAVDKIREIL